MSLIHRKTNPIRTLLVCMGAVSLFLTGFASAAVAVETDKPQAIHVRQTSKTEGGLIMLTFKTPEGQIHVVLPADMRPGDAIIGSTSLEPAGRKDADKDSNRALLGAYTLTLAGQSHPVQEPIQKWALPADMKPEGMVLALTDGSQQEAARVELPLTEPGARPSAKPGLPKTGQAGRILLINQAFPPGSDDLHVLIGDKEARLLAASPGMVAVESPRDVLGKTKLQVKRGGDLLAEGDFKNSRGHSFNPWPYVILVVVGVGIYIAVSAIQFANDFHFNGPLF